MPKEPVAQSRDNSVGSSLSSGDAAQSKMLVICVDRDNAIGVKTGISTPVVGKEQCVAAAAKLALADPEEADANTIFAAVKQCDELRNAGQQCEVVVVAGEFEKGVQGDMKIRKEIVQALKIFPATEGVIISDGIEGEEIVPVIQGVIPIVSIKRVIIKHSKSVEESYAVLGRYFKMLLFDSRYSRYALGVPGLIFLGLVLISFYVPSSYIPLVLIGLIGAVFIIRGFDIDRKIESVRELTALGYLRLFTAIASALIVLAGLVSGIAIFFVLGTPAYLVAQIVTKNPTLENLLLKLPQMVGYFLQSSQLFVFLGVGVYVTGTLVFNILRPKSRHVLRNIVALIVGGLLYPAVFYLANGLTNGFNKIDQFVAIIMFALAINFGIAAYVYHWLGKRRAQAQLTEI